MKSLRVLRGTSYGATVIVEFSAAHKVGASAAATDWGKRGPSKTEHLGGQILIYSNPTS